MILSMILASLITQQVTQQKINITEEKQNDSISIQLNSYILPVSSDVHSRKFVVGTSLAEREEKIQTDERTSKLATQTVYQRGESYTGTSSQVEIVSKDTINNCVEWAKIQTGKSGVFGAGARRGINTQDARVGEIGSEKARTHAFVVEKVEGDQITILESNYYRGFITRRVLDRSQILGFIL